MGLIPVKPDEVATIVTSLKMLERPRPAPLPASPLRRGAFSLGMGKRPT